ncbi:Uncharacterised protein [Chryseobacterium nakagawai]|uniref:Uncharacterized protein n=1 Tax=Chryseobacterium nakagawai TaxID=1241982 RepID=A0AAD0YRA0_CHRNA|nr:hypothetical protein [Chryseobacterium nakagawai]AZA93717.1 hypothetical protein EG343_25490 [Chryseobacterium nakagawai]VEH20434.1 Uncharacterised protein [Chryseobacterium nakagawai]
MKKFLNIGFSALLFGFVLISCNDDDYQTIESIDKVKIDSVKITNDTMDVFAIQRIKTYSTYSSQCQGFYGYDYIHNGNFERSVTAYKYISNGPCTQKSYSAVNQINFNPQRIGKYTFTFWSGGNNWITKTIVVK